MAWKESLAINEDWAMDDRKDGLWDLELEAFMGNIEGDLDAGFLSVALENLPKISKSATWMAAR
ncbi:hypothetical protein KBY79_10930 [Synechococcus lacustris C3-12m-Tous]|uniref:hypothetical protein n=1 Tax=Synechococcus lacustris TaxID=2116544 RepID=UPI0020CB6E78|nr:hypothetical protein [Synechococcus lacustris]MCP9925718.1 hypothetical protein [Synechococcus lacustris C3-12m-Tous]